MHQMQHSPWNRVFKLTRHDPLRLLRRPFARRGLPCPVQGVSLRCPWRVHGIRWWGHMLLSPKKESCGSVCFLRQVFVCPVWRGVQWPACLSFLPGIRQKKAQNQRPGKPSHPLRYHCTVTCGYPYGVCLAHNFDRTHDPFHGHPLLESTLKHYTTNKGSLDHSNFFRRPSNRRMVGFYLFLCNTLMVL